MPLAVRGPDASCLCGVGKSCLMKNRASQMPRMLQLETPRAGGGGGGKSSGMEGEFAHKLCGHQEHREWKASDSGRLWAGSGPDRGGRGRGNACPRSWDVEFRGEGAERRPIFREADPDNLLSRRI